jgi:hypothetical protein
MAHKEKHESSPAIRKFGYVMAIFVNIILFYVFNNLLNWHISFLTDAFTACVWILNISILSTMAANIFFIAFDEKWFRHLLHLILNIIGLIFTISLYTIFPFSFSQDTAHIVKILLIIMIFFSVISVLVETIKFVRHITTE